MADRVRNIELGNTGDTDDVASLGDIDRHTLKTQVTHHLQDLAVALGAIAIDDGHLGVGLDAGL